MLQSNREIISTIPGLSTKLNAHAEGEAVQDESEENLAERDGAVWMDASFEGEWDRTSMSVTDLLMRHAAREIETLRYACPAYHWRLIRLTMYVYFCPWSLDAASCLRE